MKKYLFIGVLILIGFAFLGSWYINRGANKFPATSLPETKEAQDSEQPAPSPTLFPFSEITIPSLREREYVSSLADLTEATDRGTYTSYITSYDSDGLKINGLLTVPKGEAPEGGWPAVVFVHGYIPPTLYDTKTRYDAYTNAIAKNGIVVFKIDLRGHGSSEGEASGAYYSADYVIDTLNAYAALASTDFVNSDKIGLWGHSMAGNVVSRAAMVQQDVPAVVIWAGAVYTYVDFREYGIQDNSYRPPVTESPSRQKRRKLIETAGEITPDNEFWKQVAPATFLKDFTGRMQLHHAVDDTVVNIEYSRNLATLLQESHIPHELFEYPSGGHNIAGTSFNQAMDRTVELFLDM